MRRFPDLHRLVARGLWSIAVGGLVAGLLWLARASDTIDAVGGDAGAIVAATAASEPGQTDGPAELPGLFEAGRRLWEQRVPPEIRDWYAFPSKDEVREFLVRLETELAEGSTSHLAAYERDARQALHLLRRVEGGDLLAAWLEPRLDLLRAAALIEADEAEPEVGIGPRVDVPELKPSPVLPQVPAARPQFSRSYWDAVIARRQPPRRAAEFVPRLKEIFREAGVPPELVWIAEVESAMNPEALSPAGARGMFQFMPLTAARFGLEAGLLVDERTDPEKSAGAAAAYLRVLHRRFRSWPLALAAYNAGEGRVGRALAAEKVSTFEDVAHRLPLETRLYVPKVLATVAVRESVDPESLPAPGVPRASPAGIFPLAAGALGLGLEAIGAVQPLSVPAPTSL